MARDITRKEPETGASTSNAVDFALVLSRMIDAINGDPQQLRSTVYELARHKLEEQAATENPEEQGRLAHALEVAIQGVETHFNGMNLQLGPPPGQTPRLGPPVDPAMAAQTAAALDSARLDDQFGVPRWQPRSSAQERGFGRKPKQFPVSRRYPVVLAIVIVVVLLAVGLGSGLLALMRHRAAPSGEVTHVVAKPVMVPPPVQAAPPPPLPDDPLIPKAYGVYAVSGGKLFSLELLPGRAPDPRVAISAPISTPSTTVLPDPHVKFIVFRRDSAVNALDHAEVRVIAKVARAMTFDPNGKPVVSKASDNWVVRNISLPYQTAPVRGHEDMYEVIGGDADKGLTAGRYGLVLKNQVYDFTVAGEITDSKHCLESIAAVNGSFYSECRKK
jgi:hypothetical protein